MKKANLILLLPLFFMTGCNGRPTYPGDADLTLDNYSQYFQFEYFQDNEAVGTATQFGKTETIYAVRSSADVIYYFPDKGYLNVTFTFETYSYSVDSKYGIIYSKTKKTVSYSADKLYSWHPSGNNTIPSLQMNGYKNISVIDVSGSVSRHK